jgi:RNA polymerase sigma factor for flagellar operon FliA
MLAVQMSDPRETLIEKYDPFVKRVVLAVIQRFGLKREDLDEYLSAGYMGLIEASERFDESHGVSFEGFAHRRVRGAVLDLIRRSSEVRGTSYHVLKAVRSLQVVEEDLVTSIAEASNSDREILSKIFSFTARGFLAIRMHGSNPEDLLEQKAEQYPSAEAAILKLEKTEEMRKVVRSLPEKERFIVEKHYFDGLSFQEIIKLRPELSKSWVSRLHSRALDQLADLLRKKMKSGDI